VLPATVSPLNVRANARKSGAPKIQFPEQSQTDCDIQSGRKKFRFTIPKIRIITISVSHPSEGRIAIVTTRGARDAMDAAVSTANGTGAYGQVVWF
jgi:hypothetical protein